MQIPDIPVGGNRRLSDLARRNGGGGETEAPHPEAPKPSLSEYLSTEIKPHLEPIEEKRVRWNEQQRKRMVVFYVALAVVVPAGIAAAFVLDFVFAIAIAVMILGGAYFWATGPSREYRKAFKSEVLPKVAGYFGEFRYAAEGKIPMTRLSPSKIIPSYDKYNAEDLFEGTYEGVSVTWNEAHLTETRGSGKNRRTVTTFRGLFIELGMNKRFNGHTVVRRDAGIFNFLGGLSSLERIKLEDPEFEKKYEVYGSDQVEARYLLTPAFMERLQTLENVIGAQGLEAAFFDEKLLICAKHAKAVNHGKDGLFEPSPLKEPIAESDSVSKMAEEVKAILEIVDHLKLMERTGV